MRQPPSDDWMHQAEVRVTEESQGMAELVPVQGAAVSSAQLARLEVRTDDDYHRHDAVFVVDLF